METRKPTAKEPNALRQRLPRKAAALAQGATIEAYRIFRADE